MNLIELNLENRNFHCPVTGLEIFGDDILEPPPATRGIWFHEIPEEPMSLSSEINQEWERYGEVVEAGEEWYDPDEFLGGLEKRNWVAFSITTSGIACGPVTSTVWIVIDMDHQEDS